MASLIEKIFQWIIRHNKPIITITVGHTYLTMFSPLVIMQMTAFFFIGRKTKKRWVTKYDDELYPKSTKTI